MILGAFVSAGVSFRQLRSQLAGLNLAEYSISEEQVVRNGIAAVRVGVQTSEKSAHRHLREVLEIIDKGSLSDAVKDNAKRVFRRLADAEAQVHATTPDRIHFHEVGAIDAIVDIVGACVCVEMLDVDDIYSRPLALGSGTVLCEHGVLPVPAPATVNLAMGFPVRMYGIGAELTTPTGDAIVTGLADPLYSAFEGSLVAVGYGAGTREIQDHPNLMRVFIAEQADDYERDGIIELCTNIDDMNPQVYSYLMERIFRIGALDAYLTPVMMKKNRPGQLLTVLCEPEKRDMIQRELFEQTSTSGIRYQMYSRVKLPRTARVISTPLGDCRVKILHLSGKTRTVPEYESVKKIADSKGMPYLAVYDAIMALLIDTGKEQ